MQDLRSVKGLLEGLMKSNPNRSLSGLFKALRKQERISFFGDYLILSFILHYGYDRVPQYLWNRNQILRGLKTSGFYRDEGLKHAYIPEEWQKFIDEK